VLLAAKPEYLGPVFLAPDPRGGALYAANFDGQRISVVDLESSTVTRTIPVSSRPTGLAVSPDGSTLYVTLGAADGRLSAINTTSGKEVFSIVLGHSPISPVLSRDGRRLFVCNRFSNSISVIDIAERRETVRIPVLREPIALAATPDGRRLLVANHLPFGRADTGNIAAEISVVDIRTAKITAVRLPNGSTGVRGLALSADGQHAYVTHILGRYQMPTTQVDRGWMNTNALSVIDAKRSRHIATVLLDEVDRGAANPWGVTVSADDRWITVAHSGTSELSIIDRPALHARIKERQGKKSPGMAGISEDLSFLLGLRRRVPLHGEGPRGVAAVGDRVYAAEYFSDSLGAVTLTADAPTVTQIRLGPPPELTQVRRGEMLFHSADLCFQNWQSCTSCHPDSRVDALNWDLLNDGVGNPKNTRTMLHAHRTPPAMSTAARESAELAVRAGIRHIQFAERPEADAQAIDEYLKSLRPVSSPALVDGKLSPAAKRGEAVFEGEEAGCAQCHSGPLFTDGKSYNVNSKGSADRTDTFDTPALVEVWRTAPYNHDGRYPTLRELLIEGNHGGVAGKLADEEMGQLVAYLRSL
jgi:YVTN family beta-propeller protein